MSAADRQKIEAEVDKAIKLNQPLLDMIEQIVTGKTKAERDMERIYKQNREGSPS
jgi:hypothetical protein